jgi:hypothetical protein
LNHSLEAIFGAPLSQTQRDQVALPIANGFPGFGINKAQLVSRCACLASCTHSLPLQEDLSKRENLTVPDAAISALTWFNSFVDAADKVDIDIIQTFKKAQHEVVLRLSKCALSAHLKESVSSSRDSARLLSASANHSGHFLSLLHSYHAGWVFQKKSFIFLCRYRVGLPLYPTISPSKRCGKPSDIFGDHASFCSNGGFLIWRHNAIRDALRRQCELGRLEVLTEERHIFLGSDQQPGDLKVYNVQQNLDFLIDVSVVSPLSSSALPNSSRKVYAAAEHMENAKIRKYKDGLMGLESRVHFIPFILETLGGWTKTTDYVIRRVAQCQAHNTDKPLSMCISNIENNISGVLSHFTAEMLLRNL